MLPSNLNAQFVNFYSKNLINKNFDLVSTSCTSVTAQALLYLLYLNLICYLLYYLELFTLFKFNLLLFNKLN